MFVVMNSVIIVPMRVSSIGWFRGGCCIDGWWSMWSGYPPWCWYGIPSQHHHHHHSTFSSSSWSKWVMSVIWIYHGVSSSSSSWCMPWFWELRRNHLWCVVVVAVVVWRIVVAFRWTTTTMMIVVLMVMTTRKWVDYSSECYYLLEVHRWPSCLLCYIRIPCFWWTRFESVK